MKDELESQKNEIRENTNFIRELAGHLRTTENEMTKNFDNKLITLKNVMTDEIRRLHNITE